VRRENGDLLDHGWAAALAAVRDTFAASCPLDAALVLDQARLDPSRLERMVRVAADGALERAALSGAAEVAYDDLLQLGRAHVVEFITSRPEFALWAHRHTVRQTAHILDQVNATLARDVVRAGSAAGLSARDRADVEFTRRSAEFVVGRLDARPCRGPPVSVRAQLRRCLSADEYRHEGSNAGVGVGLPVPTDDAFDLVARTLGIARRELIHDGSGIIQVDLHVLSLKAWPVGRGIRDRDRGRSAAACWNLIRARSTAESGYRSSMPRNCRSVADRNSRSFRRCVFVTPGLLGSGAVLSVRAIHRTSRRRGQLGTTLALISGPTTGTVVSTAP
jgi:hypothetical protein